MNATPPVLTLLDDDFSVCRFYAGAGVPSLHGFSFYSLSNDSQGLRLVLKTCETPDHIQHSEHDWLAVCINPEQANSDDAQILQLLSSNLVCQGVPSFVTSTYEADYLLTKKEAKAELLDAAKAVGTTIKEVRT